VPWCRSVLVPKCPVVEVSGSHAIGGQGHLTLGRTGGNKSKEWSGNLGARCVHMSVHPA